MKEEILNFIEKMNYEKNYSKLTLNGYLHDLCIFIEFLNEKSIKDYNEVNYQDIRLYISYLHDLNLSNKTIARHISAIRSFFKFLELNGIVKNSPITLISNPKIEKKLPKVLNYDQTQKLLSAFKNNDDISVRNNLILEMLYSTGVRVSELVNLKVKDLSLTEKSIRIIGKGNKERVVYYGTICHDLLNKYLINNYKNFNKNNSEYLFFSKTSKKINDREIRSIVTKASEIAKLEVSVSPHTLRHTFATHMLNSGADLRSVQELLGHENLSTTQIYTHLTNEKIRNVYLESFPRARRR